MDLSLLSLKEIENIILELDDFDEEPVDIETFITDSHYLGDNFTNGFRPYWMKVLKDIYPSPVFSPYSIVFLKGSIGRGKTTTVCIGMLYDIYLLLAHKSPQVYLGLTPKTKILFALFSISLELADDVIAETLTGLMSASPWFKDVLTKAKNQKLGSIFTKNVDFFIGSRIAHSLGKAVYSCMLDESSFSTSKTQVYDNFNSLLRRMQSRSISQSSGVFGMAGKAWVVSSESAKNSTLNKMLDKYIGKPGVYVDGGMLSNSALWHVVPQKYGRDRFQVFVGTESIPPRVIDFDQESDRIIKNYKDLIIEVPEEHFDDFEIDINKALQDLAGVGTVSTYKLFKLRERLNNLFGVTPIFPDTIVLDFDDESQIWDYLLISDYFDTNSMFQDKQRHIHIDVGISGDSLGIACSCVYDFRYVDMFRKDVFEKVQEFAPVTATEWAIAIRPTEGKQVPLFKIRNFINYMSNKGIFIRTISADQFQSTDLLQVMKANGYTTELLSVDRTPMPYFMLRDQTYRLFHFYPGSDLLKTELNELEVVDGKVDHPFSGSKDVADAVCGSFAMAIKYSEEVKINFMRSSGDFNPELVDMFWGNH